MLSFALILVALSPGADSVLPKGNLVAVGGGGTPKEILAKTLALAGGEKAKVLVIPQASALADTGEKSAVMWREQGAKVVSVLDTADAKAALAAVEAADLLWMPGGDQNKLAAALDKAKLTDAIAKRYAAGATVGGTSAGAAVLSKVMLTGEADTAGAKAGSTKTAAGLGLWPEAIVDQHFLRRSRFNRLLSAVVDRPDLVGVGIDEATAVVLSAGEFEVFGVSNVIVIDARKAKAEAGKKDQPIAATDITLHVLKAGMKFRLNAKP